MALSKHLEPLLDGSPLAVERITQAWPGLSNADRAHLLTILLADESKEPRALRWLHHRNRLIELALTDRDAYIRYLAAKNVSQPFTSGDGNDTTAYLEAKERFEKVQSDPVLLVRAANEEGQWKVFVQELDDPKLFWMQPQTKRLAIVNGVEESGASIAALLRYATKELLPAKTITLDELLDVLLQYLAGKTIAERVAESEDNASFFGDGGYEYTAGQSIKALWEVIPDLPKLLSYALIDCLPEEAGFETHIPPRIIDSLDDNQLEHLLWRKTITLKDLRRKLYKESTKDSLRTAALASQRFELLDSDISELTYDPGEPPESGKKKVNELVKLATFCRGATLVQIQAIYDLISNAPKDFTTLGTYDAIGFGRLLQTERAKRLSSATLEREILSMRLYTLAKNVAQTKGGDTIGELPEMLIAHKDLISTHNPWQTFLNLSKIVPIDRWKQTFGTLPEVYIPDFDLPEDPSDKLEADDDQHRHQLFDLLKEVQDRVEDVSKKDRAELSALSNALSTLSIQIEGVETATGRRVDTLQARIDKLANTVTIVLCLVGAILLLLLLRVR